MKSLLTDGMVPLTSALSFREQYEVRGVRTVRKDHYRLPYSEEGLQAILNWREESRARPLQRVGRAAGVGGCRSRRIDTG